MDIERMKEDIRNLEYDLEYGEEQNQGRIAVNVNCLRSVIDFANEAIARQSVTDEAVEDAIERLEKWRASKYAWTVASAPCGKNIDTAITALRQMRETGGLSDGY